MDSHYAPNRHQGPDMTSMLFGFAAGVVGTLLFATYKQQKFDSIVGTSRAMAGQAGDLVGNVAQSAHNMTSNLSDTAHKKIDQVDHAAHRAIDKVDKTLAGDKAVTG